MSVTSITLGLLCSFMGDVKDVMRLEVLTVVLLTIQVFWYVALCSGMWHCVLLCGTVFWYVALCSWRVVVPSSSGSDSDRRFLLDPEDEGSRCL